MNKLTSRPVNYPESNKFSNGTKIAGMQEVKRDEYVTVVTKEEQQQYWYYLGSLWDYDFQAEAMQKCQGNVRMRHFSPEGRKENEAQILKKGQDR